MSYGIYAILADVVLFVHVTFVSFVIVGQLLITVGWWNKWVWTRHITFRVLHLIAIGYVVVEAWFGITCPLTRLEYYWRDLAGESTRQMSFIGYWLHYFLFYSAPEWFFTLIYTLFGSIVFLTFLAYPPILRNNHCSTSDKLN